MFGILTAISGIVAGFFTPTPLSYVRADVIREPIIVQAPAPAVVQETLQEMSDRIALSHGISTTTLANLVSAESSWNPSAVGDDGCSLGLTQQNTCVHPDITPEMALDPETALTIAAEDIKAGRESRYSVCNCFAYVSTRVSGLPSMARITPNSTPHVGAVAIFQYKDKQTGKSVKHIAVIEELGPKGFTVAETNFTKCLFDRREIAWGDSHIVGFFLVK